MNIHEHPAMKLLELVDPVDEFSKALVLVRDCFSPSATVRELSYRALRHRLADRLGLLAAYETSVMEAARAHTGVLPSTFLDATLALPAEEFAKLRAAFNAQVNALMGRRG